MAYGDDVNDVLADARRKAIQESKDDAPRYDLSDEGLDRLFKLESGNSNSPAPLSDDELTRRWRNYAEKTDRGQGMFYIPSKTMEIFHADMTMFRFIMGPVGCIAGDARIYTKEGLTSIKELYDDGQPFEVLSLREDGSTGWEKATAPFIKGYEPLLRVDMEGNASLRIARSHLTLMQTPIDVVIDEENADQPAGEVFIGDEVQYEEVEIWRRGFDLRIGDRFAIVDKIYPRAGVTIGHAKRDITNLTLTDDDFFYDLTVKATGNYIGEWGIVHHNSGKTTGILADAQMRCMTQNPCSDGIIHNRGAFIRGTHRELKETLVDTWMHMYPTTSVRLSHPLSGSYKCLRGDGKVSVTEFLGYGMDKSGAESDMRSNAYSFGVMNECQYLGYQVIQLLRERVGRFPHTTMAPPNWRQLEGRWFWPGTNDVPGEWRWFKNLGINGDTNAPPEDHWWVYRAEKEPIPDLMTFYKQPPAMFRTWDDETEKYIYTPNRGQRPGILPAENIENLQEGWQYYIDLVRMNGDDYAARNVLNEYAPSAVGTPVFSEFNKRWHVPKGGVPRPPKGTRIFAGMDFGRTPRVILAWLDPRGRLCCFGEVKRDCGVQMFAERVLRPYVVTLGLNPWDIRIFCDPAGAALGEQSERTNIQIMREAGFDATAPNLINNSEPMRIETVRQFLTRIVGDTGGIIFDKECVDAIRALAGGYVWARIKRGGEYQDLDKPDKKSIYSHIADAIQYLCVGIKYGGVDTQDDTTRGRLRHSQRQYQPFGQVFAVEASGNNGWVV